MGLTNMILNYYSMRDARAARHAAEEALRLARESAQGRTWVPLPDERDLPAGPVSDLGRPVARPVTGAPSPPLPWYATDYPRGWTFVALAPVVCLLLAWWAPAGLWTVVAVLYLLPLGRRLCQAGLAIWLACLAGYALWRLGQMVAAGA